MAAHLYIILAGRIPFKDLYNPMASEVLPYTNAQLFNITTVLLSSTHFNIWTIDRNVQN